MLFDSNFLLITLSHYSLCFIWTAFNSNCPQDHVLLTASPSAFCIFFSSGSPLTPRWRNFNLTCLFCPAISCWHLYLPISNNLGARSTRGLPCLWDKQVLGVGVMRLALQYSKRPKLNNIASPLSRY